MENHNYQSLNSNISKSAHNKAKKIQQILKNTSIQINVKQLRSLVKQGIPDQTPKIRQYAWKILLGYLSQDQNQWTQKIKNNEQLYQQFIRSFIPQKKYQQYPLVLQKTSPRWKQLQQDFLLWQQVEKDTSRTHSQLAFFSKVCKPVLVPFFTSPRKQKFKLVYGQDQQKYQQFIKNKEQQRVTYNYDIMSRILFIYSKLNPNIKYVQGMNQVLAPIFYTVNAHKSIEQIQEASCFFMFNSAMTQIIEMHIKDLDKSQSGIYGKLKKINQMLLVIQPKIWKYFKKLNIDPFYYSFRWLALLFAQDFELFDTLRLWDSILSQNDKIEYMNFVVIAILKIQKQKILNLDFVGILERLQRVRQLDVQEIIIIANELAKQYRQTQFEQESMKAQEMMKKRKGEQKKESKKSQPTILKSFINNTLNLFK